MTRRVENRERSPGCPGFARHGVTLNSRPATSPLVMLLKGEERWEVPGHAQGVLPKNYSPKSHCHLYGSQSED
ncbi:hypothetical protein TNCV_160331 [Trichonephila clavipes]|nr:hypothetical protein TNCV_160331 [Trichonephila clavipes]